MSLYLLSLGQLAGVNIEVYQLAYYHCSVDHTGVGITWLVNGMVSTNNDTIQLGIVTYGAGSSSSSLIIPGDPQYNNTVVTCNAFGFGIINGSNYINTSTATLRIQGNTLSDMSLYLLSLGKLAAVKNLTCHVQSLYINCSWSPPFSLVSIPSYIINVTYGGELVTQNTTSSTTWEYCPSQFSNYTISVAGNNSAGEGKICTTSLHVPPGIITMVTHV